MTDEKDAALRGDVKPVARVRVGLSLFVTFALLQSPVGTQAGASVLDDPAGYKTVASIGAVSVMNPRTFRSTGGNFTQGDRESGRDWSSQAQMSPAVVRKVKSFLKKRFKERGIDPQLLKIVLARVDFLAGGEEESAIDRQYPRVRTFPSLAQQISWDHALRDIHQEFEQKFLPYTRSQHITFMIMDSEGEFLKSPRWFLVRVHKMIEEAQGRFSAMMKIRQVPAEYGYSLGAIKNPRSWAGPLRIAPSGSEALDLKVAKYVATHAARGSVIDSKSFPSQAENQNVFLQKMDRVRITVQWIMSCGTYMYCISPTDYTMIDSLKGEAEVPKTDLRFFRKLYSLNPYGQGISTVVQVDSTGKIVAGYAGGSDLGIEFAGHFNVAADGRIAGAFTQLSQPFNPSINREIGLAELEIK